MRPKVIYLDNAPLLERNSSISTASHFSSIAEKTDRRADFVQSIVKNRIALALGYETPNMTSETIDVSIRKAVRSVNSLTYEFAQSIAIMVLNDTIYDSDIDAEVKFHAINTKRIMTDLYDYPNTALSYKND